MPDQRKRHMSDEQPVKAEPKPLFHVGQEGVTTRDGRKVRILCVDMKGGDENMVALVEHDDGCSEFTRTYFANGRYILSEEDARDLIPPPPPKQYAWTVVYRDRDGLLYASDIYDEPMAKYQCGSAAVGCIRIELAERWDD